MFKGVFWCIPSVSILWSVQLYYSPLHLPRPLFNSFQCILLHPLPSQILCID
jgi:hypothetical protein